MVCSSCDGPQKRDGYTTPALREGQEKGPAGCVSRRAPSERTRASGDGPYRGCLEPLVALGDLELHPLPLDERLVAVHGDLGVVPVSYTHLRAHETRHDIVCRLLLEKKNQRLMHN